MGKGSSQNTMTMGPTYGGPPGPPVNYNSLNYGGGSGLMPRHLQVQAKVAWPQQGEAAASWAVALEALLSFNPQAKAAGYKHRATLGQI